MISKILMYILLHIAIITINLTPSRLLLLFIISITILKLQKWALNYNKIDKFTFNSSRQHSKSFRKSSQLKEPSILAQFLSIILQNKKRIFQVWMLMFSIFTILLTQILQPKIMTIIIFNIIVIILIMKYQIKKNNIQIKTKLGIKHTSSFFLQENDSPLKKLSKKQSVENYSPTRKIFI